MSGYIGRSMITTAEGWAQRIHYEPIPLDRATHLIVGVGESELGIFSMGLLATSDNEFQAYRIVREIRKQGKAAVAIRRNSAEEIAKLQAALKLSIGK